MSNPRYNGDLGNFSPIKPITVIRTRANGTHGILERLKLDIVTLAAAIERFQAVVRRVLKDVKRIRHLEVAPHAVRLHGVGDVGRAAAVPLLPEPSVEARVAGHKEHVVRLDHVGGELEDGLVGVGVQALADGGRGGAAERVPRVGHGEVLGGCFVRRAPGHEVDDLGAVEVDDAEAGAGGDFEGVAVRCGHDGRVGLAEGRELPDGLPPGGQDGEVAAVVAREAAVFAEAAFGACSGARVTALVASLTGSEAEDARVVVLVSVSGPMVGAGGGLW